MSDKSNILSFDGRAAEVMFLDIINSINCIEVKNLVCSPIKGSFYNYTLDKHISFYIKGSKLIVKSDKSKEIADQILKEEAV